MLIPGAGGWPVPRAERSPCDVGSSPMSVQKIAASLHGPTGSAGLMVVFGCGKVGKATVCVGLI